MTKNPKRALEAVTADGETVRGIRVREMTLGLSAVLEAVGSPLVTGVPPKTMGEMLPTIYVMTRPAADSQALLASGGRAALEGAAVAWADGLTTDAGLELAAACGRSARRVARVSPQGLPDKGGPEGNGSAAGTAG